MSDIVYVKHEFPPIYDTHSTVLILGSFPSVKSREVSFYYGNKQNRFWRMIYGYFGEEEEEGTQERIDFLHRNRIALYDMIESCRIEGSSDSKITDCTVADLTPIFSAAKLKGILLNGSKAYELFEEHYANVGIPFYKMPSTSPANPRYEQQVWRNTLDELFRSDR